MNENKKNIGLLLRDFNIIGGIERVASTLSFGLSEYFNIFVIVYSDKNRAFDHSGKLIVLKGSNGYRLTRFFNKIFSLRKIIKENNLYSVISFGEHSNFLNIISKSSNKAILTIHSYKSKEESERGDIRGFINKILIKFLYNKSDRIITVSEALKDDLSASFKIKPSKITPVYNPFDIVKIRELSEKGVPKDYLRSGKEIVLITIGRICDTKAFWHLIRAFSELKKDFPKIRLDIVGEAYLPAEIEVKKKLTGLINDYKMASNVIFIDFTPNPYPLLKNADVFVSSSILEGFGNVIVESMICSIPVVFPDCKAGPREIIAPGTGRPKLKNEIEFAEFGILTPVCDGKYRNADLPLTKEEKLLADAVKHLLKDSTMHKKYSEKGMIRALDFDSEKIIREYVNVIEGSH